MTELAANLIDHVIPFVPVRQWVLSLPHRLRYLLGYNHELCRKTLKFFAKAVLGFYRGGARKRGIPASQTGTVTFIQRFGSALNLNLHFHLLAMDGVFTTSPNAAAQFHALPPPTDEEVAQLLARVYRRVLSCLESKNVPLDDDGLLDPFCDEAPTLAACYSASVRNRIGLGPKAGHSVARAGSDPYAAWVESRGKCHAHFQGFDLHARLRIPARQRKRLEQLIRYCARPPLSNARLSRLADGRVCLRLKTPWNDGTTHFVFDPPTFIEKLTALIPRPRVNLVIYHGLLAPNASWRNQIVGYARHRIKKKRRSPNPRGRRQWAELMRRAFGFELLACPNCAGKMKLLACITQRSAIRAILTSLKLPADPAPIQPARGPPRFAESDFDMDASA